MILIVAETANGQIRKSSFEVVTYGKKVADMTGTSCAALVLGSADNAGALGTYGADKVIHVSDASLDVLDTGAYANVISQVAQAQGASLVVLSHSSTGKSLLGRLAVRLDAASLSGVNALPTADGDVLSFTKGVFAGKASATYALSGAAKVVTLMGNSIKPEELGSPVAAESASVEVPSSKTTLVSRNMQDGDTVPLPEAELVVSAGRGMKGPENWGIIEELAKELGATTACSRPVADTGWRPHHEHVGQTGVAIKPNLYIAAGISGAIQHLAGVNSSKVIVVINKDPEAPFFKAADYGVVGDLFDVVPKLTAAIRNAK